MPYLREAVRARPADSIARHNLGGAPLATGHLDEATLDLRGAGEIDPRSLHATTTRAATSLCAAGGVRPSSNLEQALRIATGDPDARPALPGLKAGRLDN